MTTKSGNPGPYGFGRLHRPAAAFMAVIVLTCMNAALLRASDTPVVENTYRMLDAVVREKHGQLVDYLDAVRNTAGDVVADPLMRKYFTLRHTSFQLQRHGALPDDYADTIERLEERIKQHYIRNYRIFYDVLFISNEGDVFYTIRKQNDYGKNIFSSEANDTSLSRHLGSAPDEMFVDYHYYTASGEPSAFIIQPLCENGDRIGWVVLQCAINGIDRIFSRDGRLGATGEVVLVNRDHYLLTNSKFRPGSTILRQQLPEENIESKFQEREGHKTVIDYRGKKVVTSFRVCTVFGSEWLIIAKIDENEIVTGCYSRNRDTLGTGLVEAAKRADHPVCPPFSPGGDTIEVDMDEYHRASDNEIIHTHGVSSCTALLITYPGRFSYLAHVSPYDRLYGEDRTDLLANMLRDIGRFEIYPSEKQELGFYLISPHDDAVQETVARLVDAGYFLSQITVLCNEQADYANVFNAYGKNLTVVEWVGSGPADVTEWWDVSDAASLDDLAGNIFPGTYALE